MIQDSSRTRRLEGEDSVNSVRESVAYSSCCLAWFAALESAWFVRGVPTSHTSHIRSGGIPTNNASVSSGTDPDHVVRPASAMLPTKTPSVTETVAVPCELGLCAIFHAALKAGPSEISRSAIQ
jgi:hypothetical protein